MLINNSVGKLKKMMESGGDISRWIMFYNGHGSADGAISIRKN